MCAGEPRRSRWVATAVPLNPPPITTIVGPARLMGAWRISGGPSRIMHIPMAEKRSPDGASQRERAEALQELLAERILVLDGATGTWMQAQDLTDEDFGGPELEGCNENLVLTRPDLVRRMHAEYFAAGAD